MGAWWYATSRPDYRLQRGREALERGRWDEAERLATALSAGGYGDHAHLLRAETFFHQQRYAEALEALRQIPDESPLRVDSAALYGQWMLVAFKQSREAEQAYLFVLQQRPDHVDAHRGLSTIYFDQGATTRALHHCEEWARLAPRDGRPCRFIGFMYKDLMQFNEAIPWYRQALDRELSDRVAEEVRLELAECLVKHLDYAETLKALDDCTPAPDDMPKLVMLRAEALLGLGRGDEAKAELDSALAKNPHAVELLRLRGKLYVQDNQMRDAVPVLERALELDRNDYESRYQLAQALKNLGRQAEAENQLRLLKETQDRLQEVSDLSQKAVNNPWDASLHKRLAELYQLLGRPKQAAEELKAAAACPPGPGPSPPQIGEQGARVP